MQNMAKRLLLAMAAGASLILTGVEAKAAVVTYSFTGEWDSVFTQSGSTFNFLTAGDAFSGTLTFEEFASNDLAPDPNQFSYMSGLISTTTGGQTFTIFPGINTIFGQYDDTSDIWQDQSYGGVGYGSGQADVNGNPIYYLFQILQLAADQDSDIHPEFGPLTSSFFSLQAGILDETGLNYADIVNHQGRITSFQLSDQTPAVPLPAALPLFAAGLSAMGFLGWRKKRKTPATTARARKSYNKLILTSLLSIGLFSGVGLGSAAASPIDVSFVVSGSSGDWSYDFSVMNNLGGTNQIYAFNIVLPTATITGSPTLWAPTVGSNQWCYVSCYSPFSNLQPGQTLSGFIAHDTSVAALNSISWIIAAIGGYYDGPAGTFGNTPYNPTFEGVASLSSVPLPAALPLYAASLGIFGYLARRKNKQRAPLRAST